MNLFNKTIEQLTVEDFKSIIDDPDYKECTFIDYKTDFAFLRVDGQLKNEKKNDFRNDICAFANADGGYLIFGVHENKSVPDEIKGVEITTSIETFEQARRQDIVKILPVPPSVKFKFIEIEVNKYIVVLEIQKGFHKPYVNDSNPAYRFLTRDSNGNRGLNYKEVQLMFNQSIILVEEINNYRHKTMDFLLKNEIRYPDTPFSIISIIPENFLDIETYNEPILNKGFINYYDIFKYQDVSNLIPNVTGLNLKCNNSSEIQVNRNNILEQYIDLKDYFVRLNDINKNKLCIEDFFRSITLFIYASIEYYKKINLVGKIYICFSILACKNVISDKVEDGRIIAEIDRNNIISDPIALNNYRNESEVEEMVRNLKISLCLSLGIEHFQKHIMLL